SVRRYCDRLKPLTPIPVAALTDPMSVRIPIRAGSPLLADYMSVGAIPGWRHPRLAPSRSALPSAPASIPTSAPPSSAEGPKFTGSRASISPVRQLLRRRRLREHRLGRHDALRQRASFHDFLDRLHDLRADERVALDHEIELAGRQFLQRPAGSVHGDEDDVLARPEAVFLDRFHGA